MMISPNRPNDLRRMLSIITILNYRCFIKGEWEENDPLAWVPSNKATDFKVNFIKKGRS